VDHVVVPQALKQRRHVTDRCDHCAYVLDPLEPTQKAREAGIYRKEGDREAVDLVEVADEAESLDRLAAKNTQGWGDHADADGARWFAAHDAALQWEVA
jgi:hypothetical protein